MKSRKRMTDVDRPLGRLSLLLRCETSSILVSENAARNQLAPACAQRRSQKINQAIPSLSHSPVRAPVPVRTHCTNAWWNRCKTDLNSFPRRKLDEITGTSSYYMDANHSAGSEIQQPQYGWRSWPGSEPSTLEIDVYVRRYALSVVLARNDDDDDVKLLFNNYNNYYYSVLLQLKQAVNDWPLGRLSLSSAVVTATLPLRTSKKKSGGLL